MKANYINIDGVTGLHVEFKNGFIMNIPVEFDNEKEVRDVFLNLLWTENYLTEEWDIGKSFACNYLNATYRPVKYRDDSVICLDLEDEKPYAVYVDITGYPRLAPFALQKFFISRCYQVVPEVWSIPLYKLTMPKLPKEVPDMTWDIDVVYDDVDKMFHDWIDEQIEEIFNDYLADWYNNVDLNKRTT